MNADFSYSLEALERRWQLEKTPQVGLRLAEQYRRRADLAAAIETLTAGLEIYPDHTASRVALSRDLVEGDRFGDAVPHLEQIVALDASHLVANKLMVRAYAGVGRIDDARDKLAIYEMMGEGDSDIEQLHELLEAARGGGVAGSAQTRSVEVPGDPLPGAPAPGLAGADDEPFGPALTPGKPADYWQQVADEGIFVFETPAAGADSGVEDGAQAEEPIVAGDSTVTLGELYLEQGHSRAAAQVFEEVLTREPENPAAQRGLEVTKEPAVASAAVTAGAPAVWVDSDTDAAAGGSVSSLVERKQLALTTYLAQLRRAIAAGI